MLHQRGKPYSQDLRERVFAAADSGSTVGMVAKTLMVSVSYVSKFLGRRRLTGETTAKPQRCHVPPKLEPYYDAIRARVAQTPDATIAELRRWLGQTHTIAASQGLMWKVLAQLELTLKKSPSTRPNRTARMSPRRAWHGVTHSPDWTLAG